MGKSLCDTLDNLEDSLKQIIKGQNKLLAHYSDETIINDLEFRDFMDISFETSIKWRETGLIGYFQIEDEVYYKMKDVKAMMLENYNPSKKIESRNVGKRVVKPIKK